MKKSLLIFAAILFLFNVSFSQNIPGFRIISTYDSTSIGYLEIPDELGNLGSSGWIWHLIDDVSQNGANPPSIDESTMGYPTGDDILISTGIIGDDELVPDTIRTMIKFLRDTRINYFAGPYLRIYSGSSIEDSTAYMQLPILNSSAYNNEEKLIQIPLQSFGTGGIMTSWLSEDGIPDDMDDLCNSEAQEISSLQLSDNTIAYFVGVPDNGVHSATLTRHDTQPLRWTMSNISLPHITTLSQDCRQAEIQSINQSLKINFSADEVAQLYDNEYSPEDMRVYREVVDNWVELPTTVTNEGGWFAEISSDTGFLFGRYVIAPQGLYNDAPQTDTELITEYRLYPAYPNPFNPSTTILVDIPDKTIATIQVYDILGREVTSIYNGELFPGKHKFIFNAENYASGTYFLRLKSDVYSSIQRLVLLK